MFLLYISLDFPTVSIAIGILILSIIVGNVGRHTALGYWGVLLLSLLLTPVVGYIIVRLFQEQSRSKPGI